MAHECYMQLILVLTSQNFCCTTARRRHVEGVSTLAVASRLQCFPQTRAGNTVAQVRQGQAVRRHYDRGHHGRVVSRHHVLRPKRWESATVGEPSERIVLFMFQRP